MGNHFYCSGCVICLIGFPFYFVEVWDFAWRYSYGITDQLNVFFKLFEPSDEVHKKIASVGEVSEVVDNSLPYAAMWSIYLSLPELGLVESLIQPFNDFVEFTLEEGVNRDTGLSIFVDGDQSVPRIADECEFEEVLEVSFPHAFRY